LPEVSKTLGWCMLVWAALSNVGGSVAMKFFHRAKGETLELGLNANLKYLAIALFCYVSSFAAYLVVLKVIPVSIAYPLITGLTIMMVLAVARAFLGEALSTTMILGSAFIVVGIALIGGHAN
jgi:undecaprenyl phosphate-alpha-L-ara4N flippase subunit ArnE